MTFCALFWSFLVLLFKFSDFLLHPSVVYSLYGHLNSAQRQVLEVHDRTGRTFWLRAILADSGSFSFLAVSGIFVLLFGYVLY